MGLRPLPGLFRLGGRPASELWGWIRLLSLYDVVFLALATLLFPVVVDE